MTRLDHRTIKEVFWFCLNYDDFFEKGIFARKLLNTRANEDCEVKNASPHRLIRHYSAHSVSRNHSYKTFSKLNGSTMSYKNDSEKLDGPNSVL